MELRSVTSEDGGGVQKDHLKKANNKRKAYHGPQSQFWLSESLSED